MISQALQDALNKQVGEEFSASSQYTAMAFYFEGETLPQLAGYFHAQAEEERLHAMKFLHYLSDAGAQVIVPGSREPKNHFEDAEEVVRLALNQELKVTDQINKLVDLAIQESDHLTRQFLQWFVTEQLEEVSSMSDLLRVVERAGKTNLLLVEDFLARNPRPDAAGEAEAA
jgi:ferritin